MRTMAWEEITADWEGLRKRNRAEISQRVVKYCVGHKIEEVAKHLGFGRKWVQEHLDFAGVAEAIGPGPTGVCYRASTRAASQLDFAGVAEAVGSGPTGAGAGTTSALWEAPGTGEATSNNKLRPAVQKVIETYKPDCTQRPQLSWTPVVSKSKSTNWTSVRRVSGLGIVAALCLVPIGG